MLQISITWAIVTGLFHFLWLVIYPHDFFSFYDPRNWRYYEIQWGKYTVFMLYSLSFVAALTYVILCV